MATTFVVRCTQQETDFGVVTYWVFNGSWYGERAAVDAAIDALRTEATRLGLAVQIEIVEVLRRIGYPKHW